MYPTPSLSAANLVEQVLHAMPWGVIALDDQGAVRLLNSHAAQLLGLAADYDPAALLGQQLESIFPPDFPPELRAALHEARSATSPITGEFHLPYCERWIELTTQPGKAQVLLYWQDITQIVTKRQQYQALANNTPDALARWDTNLRLRYANPALAAEFGQPLAALLGKTLSELGVRAQLEKPYTAAVQRVFDTGQPQRHLYALPSPQGEQHYQAHLVPEVRDGHVLTVLAIAHNVTELREAELKAAAQAHFRHQLAATSPDRILVRDLASGRVAYVNRAVLPELGYDPDERLAAHARGEVPFPGWPSDQAALTAYWAALTTADDDATPLIEHRLRALDGTWQWYRMRGKVFARDAQDRPTQALSVAANITDEKQAQAELLRLQLGQQRQLANAVLTAQEVERRRIAEALLNGLGQVLYATKLQLTTLTATADAAAFADGKQKALDSLTAAIAQVRALSQQLIPTVLEDFGLAAAVQDICRYFRTPALALHCATTALPALPPSLALAVYRMAQEMVNNVVQHAQATEARLSLGESAGWLELCIEDNGRGFDAALPQPTGLGLKALRNRVQLLNGELTITSSPAQGTRLTVRVPLTAAADK